MHQRPRVFLSKPLDSSVLNWWMEKEQYMEDPTGDFKGPGCTGVHHAGSHLTDQKTATHTRLTEREAEKYQEPFSKPPGK